MQEPYHPSLAEVLALPVLAAGQPEVVSGADALDRPVRWVHITELTDPASFLKGGELILTTGMPLSEEPAQIRRYVDELADVGAACLVIELVRRYHQPPEELVRACRARGLPLVTLARDVNFLEVTQVVHALILARQTAAIHRTQQIHEEFTALTLRGAGLEEVLRAAARASGRAVVLENLVHQAVFCEPGGDDSVAAALADWERRSRTAPEGWLAVPVEYRGERWGRVVMLPGPGRPEDAIVLERTAMALTIARLIHPVPWERRAHRNALTDLAEQRYRSPADARARAEALGLPTGGVIAVLVDTPDAEDALARELAAKGARSLIGELRPGRIGILLATGTAWRPLVEQLSRTARVLDANAVVSVGCEVPDVAQAARSFHVAHRVAEAVLPTAEKLFHELSDIGLPELLHSLRDDVRVQDYVEAQLGRLIDHDARHGTELIPTLRHYLDAAGNKTAAARRGGLSRMTLYDRLRAIERLLDVDLESGTHRTQLHVALTALDVLRPTAT